MLICDMCEKLIDDTGLPDYLQGRYVVGKYPWSEKVYLSCCLSNLEETVNGSREVAEEFLRLSNDWAI